MTDTYFEDVLRQAYEKEFLEFENAPEHKFSGRHNRQMKRIFRLYNKNSAPEETFMPIKKRLLVAIVTIFAAVVLAVAAVGIATNGFSFKQHVDYTKALAVGWERAPTEIEDVYEIAAPNGFEATNVFDTKTLIQTNYNVGDECIFFSQYVKENFSGNFNTEGYELVEACVNGRFGFYIQFEDACILAWDNGDYILEIYSTLPIDDVLRLAENAKKSARDSRADNQ